MSEGKNNILEKSERPWGTYEVYLDSDKSKVKLIEVNPKSRLSLQKHLKRSEHWYIIEGELLVEKGMQDVTPYNLKKGDSINIPQGFWHRASNRSESPAKFIEIQTGDYFGEDDIIRKEDDYGRA